jgi:hypothetical protein
MMWVTKLGKGDHRLGSIMQFGHLFLLQEITMNKWLSALLLLTASGAALAQVAPVPEIDAASGTGALALLVGAVALIGERRRKR